VASGEIGCQKVHEGVVESLRSQPDGARTRVVVWVSLPQVAAWCADPSVRSVDVWE